MRTKHGKRVLWWMLVLAAAVMFGCGGDDDDDNDDDDTYDPNGDKYPDSLQPCPSYVEASPWFEYVDEAIASKHIEFYDLYGVDFAPGEVDFYYDTFRFIAGPWTLMLRWLATDVEMPFEDGDEVQVFLGPYEGYDSQAPVLWVLDPYGETLLFQDGTYGDRTEQIGEHGYVIVDTYDCEYFESMGELPPEPYWAPWRRAIGCGQTGSLDSHVFRMWAGYPNGASEDGILRIRVPYAYEGRVDYDRMDWADADPRYDAKRLVQMIRTY